MPPETDFGRRFPRKALTRNPTSGRSGMRSSIVNGHGHSSAPSHEDTKITKTIVDFVIFVTLCS